jgi:hypothetical protein
MMASSCGDFKPCFMFFLMATIQAPFHQAIHASMDTAMLAAVVASLHQYVFTTLACG